MVRTIEAVFDGEVLRPEDPLAFLDQQNRRREALSSYDHGTAISLCVLWPKWIVACTAVLLITGCPFQGSVYEEDMVAGYAVCATDVIEDAAIILKDEGGRGGGVVVPAMVFAYGWNEEFILAKRRPRQHATTRGDPVEWYIVQVRNRQIHGPMTEDEFQKSRTALGVPGGLSFTRTTRLH